MTRGGAGVAALALLLAAAGARAEQNLMLCVANGSANLSMDDDCEMETYLQNGAQDSGAGICVILCVLTCCCCFWCMSGRVCCNCCGGSSANPDNFCMGAAKGGEVGPDGQRVEKSAAELEQEHRRKYWALSLPCNPIGAKLMMLLPILLCLASFAITYAGMPKISDGYDAAWTMLDEGLAWMDSEVAAIKGILKLPNGEYVVGIDESYFKDVNDALDEAKTERDKLKKDADLNNEFALAGLILGIFPMVFALCALPCCVFNCRGGMHALICLVMPVTALLWLMGGITLFLHYFITDACYECKRVRDGHFDGLLAGKFLGPICPRDQLETAKKDLIQSETTSLNQACTAMLEVCDQYSAYPDPTSPTYPAECKDSNGIPLLNPPNNPLCLHPDRNAKKVWICQPEDLQNSTYMCSHGTQQLGAYTRSLQMKTGVPAKYSCATRETDPNAPCGPFQCAVDCTGPDRAQQMEASRDVTEAIDAGERAERAFDNHLSDLLDCNVLMRKIIGGYNEPNVTGWVAGCEDMRDGIEAVGQGLVLGAAALTALAFAAMMGHKRFVARPSKDGAPAAPAVLGADGGQPAQALQVVPGAGDAPKDDEKEMKAHAPVPENPTSPEQPAKQAASPPLLQEVGDADKSG